LVIRRNGVDPNRGSTWRSIVVSSRAHVVARRSCRVGSQSRAQSASVISPRRGSSHVADTSDASISVRRRSASSRRANVSLWAMPSASR
jgi:hypothetical protein